MVKPSLAALAARYGSDTPPRISDTTIPPIPRAPSKPYLDISNLPGTAVRIPTKEDYTLLMRVLECASWMWKSGARPTSFDMWGDRKDSLYINVSRESKEITWGEVGTYDKPILSPGEFYAAQKVTPDLLEAVQQYFEHIQTV